MHLFKTICVSLFLITGLTACQKPIITYAYLMQHPAFLQEQLARCHADASTSDDCRLVMSAANDFASLLNEQQQDPEQFGQRLLMTQMLCQKNVADKSCNDIPIWLAVIGVNSPE